MEREVSPLRYDVDVDDLKFRGLPKFFGGVSDRSEAGQPDTGGKLHFTKYELPKVSKRLFLIYSVA
jgi:hypothetical protein